MPPEPRDQRAVVNMLAALPFSDAKLQKARQALGGDLPALSTALESAAARARDQSVAGRLLLEASRVQLQELKQRRRGLMLLKAALEQHPDDPDARNELAEALRDPENQTVYEGMLRQRAESLAKLSDNDARLAVRAGEAYSRLADFFDSLGDSARSAETRRLAAKLGHGAARSLSSSPAAPRTASVKPSSPASVKPSSPASIKPSSPASIKPSSPASIKPSSPASVKPSAPSSSPPPASPRPRVSPSTSAPSSPSSGMPLPSVRATQERSLPSGRVALPAQPRSMSPRPGSVAAARPATPSTAPTRPPPPDSNASAAPESSLSRPVSAVPRPIPRPGPRSGAPAAPSTESVGEAPTIEVAELGAEEMAALLELAEEDSEQ